MQRPTLALAVAVLCALLPTPGLAAAASRVAILPTVVHSADQHDFLRQGLSDMLSSRLGQMKGLSVVRIDDPAKATADLATAQATARAVGAEWVVFGSFTRFGEGASLDLQCASVAGGEEPSRALFVQAGTLGEIIPKLDDVATRIATYVESGGTATGSVAAAPPRAADVSRTEVEDLRRRVEALERAQRAAATPAPTSATGNSGARTTAGE